MPVREACGAYKYSCVRRSQHIAVNLKSALHIARITPPFWQIITIERVEYAFLVEYQTKLATCTQ